ncbi:hypothetical protein QJQ45_014463 [Haematococcus lacustris]|nr:hypothetical protein QJQ45_014463 [Haematococcus lacustris]
MLSRSLPVTSHSFLSVRSVPSVAATRVRLVQVVCAAANVEPAPKGRRKKPKPYDRSPTARQLYVKGKLEEATKLYPETDQDRLEAWVKSQWLKISDEEKLLYEEEAKRVRKERNAAKAQQKSLTPLSTYQLFTKEFMAKAKQSDDTLAQEDVFKQVGPAWVALTPKMMAEWEKKTKAHNDAIAKIKGQQQ